MPFGPYTDFADCVKKTLAKKDKWSKERASAYCAVIERTIAKRKKGESDSKQDPEPPKPGSGPGAGASKKPSYPKASVSRYPKV